MSNFNVVQIGCGVVGGAYVEAYSKKNINAICVEYNETIIENLKQLGFEAYKNNTVPELQNIDFVFLSICTPFNEMIQKLDMKYLDSTVVDVSNILKGSPDALVIVRSTVNIGYTKEYQDMFLEIDIEIIIIDELAGKRPETKNKIICKSNNKNNIIQLSYNGSNHYKYYY